MQLLTQKKLLRSFNTSTNKSTCLSYGWSLNLKKESVMVSHEILVAVVQLGL